MSRLYIKTTSDIGKGIGKGASQFCSAQINWGSAGDSKKVASLEVRWLKGEKYPEVGIVIGESENPVKITSIIKEGVIENDN